MKYISMCFYFQKIIPYLIVPTGEELQCILKVGSAI